MKHKDGLQFYKQGKQFRWRVRRKGRIIASSSEGYSRVEKAVKNFESIAEYFYCELGEHLDKFVIKSVKGKIIWETRK